MTEITPKAVKAARTRQLAAAKRSLKLIAEAAAADLATLENSGVPGDSFLPSALKYEHARQALTQLDALVAGGDDDEVLVPREHLRLFVQVLAEFGMAGGARPGDGSPLGDLAAAAGLTTLAAQPAQTVQEATS